VLVPGRGESLNVLINTQETTNAAAYSSCTPDIPKNEPPSGGLPVVPEKYGVQLALNDAIDTGTAAAGDLITATVSKDVVSRDGIAILLRKGTRVRGRILNLARWIENGKDPYFVIAISFDEADIDGVASPFRVKLDRSLMAVALGNDSSRWPENSLVFGTRAERYQVPRGFESWWMTIR
jgi:hypothetical protein